MLDTTAPLTLTLAFALTLATTAAAQTSGNVGFVENGRRARLEQQERALRTSTKEELPPNDHSMFVEASVLMNVKADEYVAVFALAHEGKTTEECARAIDQTTSAFRKALKEMSIDGDDVFVDFVTQTKTYGYEFAGDVAREKHVGFELKKNVSVRYKDRALVDRLVAVAAQLDIHDLVKVDYVVTDLKAVHDRLAKDVSAVVKRKADGYGANLGIGLRLPGQVYLDRTAAYYPSQMYDSYTAASTEDIPTPFDRQRFTVHSVRKGRTFFFNGLDGAGFDEVVNPVIVEPVVQFTAHLKVRYELKPNPAR